jgi:hypothetical protein
VSAERNTEDGLFLSSCLNRHCSDLLHGRCKKLVEDIAPENYIYNAACSEVTGAKGSLRAAYFLLGRLVALVELSEALRQNGGGEV